MSSPKKLVITYAKSLFRTIRNSQPGQEKRVLFNQETVDTSFTKPEVSTFVPTVYIIGEELILVRSAILTSTKLKEFFKNPTYLEKQKLEVLLAIFPGLTIPLKAFFKVLTERSHLSLIPEICEEYGRLLLEFKNYVKVKLTISASLQENYGPLLLTTLKKVTNGKEIILNVSYDPKLLGGLILEYKSVVVDLSLLKEFSLFFNEI